ncbi:hypothetical protein QQG74_14665 [Micromonospora sp. FIMYZ51]|uniref:hypothetical protein n=1 Tax=Micromonospora sp. FIMYZ51 TaxID=3051832 RepID=UPI00311EBA68
MAGGAWRDGAVVAAEAAPVTTARVPFVPDPVTLFAYLPAAALRIARDLELTALDWFNGFAGEHVVRALTAGGDPDGAVDRLRRAAELDLFGGEAYQILVLRAEDRTGRVRGLVTHGRDASRITGEVAAYAAEVVLRGQVPAGVHHAGFVLDPASTVDALLAAGALVSAVPIDGDPCADDATEDGAL